MLSTQEKLRRADERVARQKRQERIELRQEREDKKKEQQRRNYAVGELVLKYFPQIVDLAKFEQLLSMLASITTGQLEAPITATGNGTEMPSQRQKV